MANTQLTLTQQIERPEMVSKFAKTLGNDQIKTQKFLRSVVLAVQGNSKLKQAEPMSVLSAAMVAASLDLEVNPSLGLAAIVPFKTKKQVQIKQTDATGKELVTTKSEEVMLAQLQIMTRGLTQLFFRTGQAKALNPFIVYEDEHPRYDKITGRLVLDNHDDSCTKVVGYGCYMELTNGFSKTEYWSKERVENHAMKYSQAYKNGYDSPWKSAFDSMSLKSVTKAVLKYAPLSTTNESTAMQLALQADQAIINTNTDDTFDFNYADNPNNDNVESVQYSEEETKLRVDTLEVLHNNGISDENICTKYKVTDISLVSTEELKKTAEVVIANAPKTEEVKA